MKKYLLSLKSVLTLLALFVGFGSAFAWDVRLSDKYEVAGYKAKAFYDFKTDADAIALVPTDGDFRYRDANNGWFNFGSGGRGADIAIPVSKDDIIIFDFYDTQNRSITINSVTNGTKDEALSVTYPTFKISDDAESINVNIGRGGNVMSILVMEKDNVEIITNTGFGVVGPVASGATDRYAVGEPWVSNVTFANMGIRVMSSTVAEVDGNVLVWRGSGNNNYISQPAKGLKPNTSYEVSVSQVAAGNAGADFIVGFGAEAGGYELASNTVRLGNTVENDVKKAVITTPASLPESVYFTFRNTPNNTATSGSDPVSQIDFITVEVSSIEAVKDAAIAKLPSTANGIFSISEDAVNKAKQAIEDAKSEDEITAALASLADIKCEAESGTYTLKNVTAEGYLAFSAEGGVLLSETPTNVTFVKSEGKFKMMNAEGEYVDYAGGNNWTMTANATGADFTPALADNAYSFTGKNGFLGSNLNDKAVGSAVYGDKKVNNGNYMWIIEKVGGSEPQPEPKPEKPVLNFSEIVSGQNYYLYNVEYDGFLVGANDWGTRASVAHTESKEFTITAINGGTYKIGEMSPDNADGIWVDGSRPGNDQFTFTYNSADKTYLIGCTKFEGMFITWTGDENNTRVNFTASTTNGTWAAVTPADYKAYLEACIKYEEAIGDYTRRMSNDKAKWAGASNGYGGGAERYIETGMPSGEIMVQTIENLPAGKYEVKFYGIANVARNLDVNVWAGDGIAYVFANESKQNITVGTKAGLDDADWTAGERTIICEVGEDGILRYGLANVKEGGQWYVAKIISLTLMGNDKPSGSLVLKSITFDAPAIAASSDFEGTSKVGVKVPFTCDPAELVPAIYVFADYKILEGTDVVAEGSSDFIGAGTFWVEDEDVAKLQSGHTYTIVIPVDGMRVYNLADNTGDDADVDCTSKCVFTNTTEVSVGELAPGNKQKAIALSFTYDEATGINGIANSLTPVKVYDLTGREVKSMTRGSIYIVNGKKMLVK